MDETQRAAKQALIAAIHQAKETNLGAVIGYNENFMRAILKLLQSHDEEDYDLTAEQLDEKYSPDGDGEHPRYTRDYWKEAVQLGHTFCGYWDWVEYRLDSEGA